MFNQLIYHEQNTSSVEEDFNVDGSTGCPDTSNTDENFEAMKKMISVTVREVTKDVGIVFGSCQTIFTDGLDIKRATANIISKLIIFEQKESSMDIV